MIFSTLLGKTMCHFFGHRRGRRVNPGLSTLTNVLYRCPRCGAQWDRKQRKPKGA